MNDTVTVGASKILTAFLQGKPFAVGKMGSNELQICICYLQDISGQGANESLLLKYRKHVTFNLCTGAGIYPYRLGSCYTYVERLLDDLKDLDYCAIWDKNYKDIERSIVKLQNPLFTEIDLTDIEPYYSPVPWTYFLQGKNVLVISCFADTIEKQYARRDKIWKSSSILPDFTLKTLYFPHSYYITQTTDVNMDTIHQIPVDTSLSVGGAGLMDSVVDTYPPSWKEILDAFVLRMKHIDYDVCLIGAGAYGVPLAVECKRQGKIGIHLGGALQILFGIRGGRWDSSIEFQRLFNEYWVRPSKYEVPTQSRVVENGCYY